MKSQFFLIALLMAVSFSSLAQNDGSALSSDSRPISSSTAFAIDKNIISFEVANLVDKNILEFVPHSNYGGIPESWSPHRWSIILIMAEGTDITRLAPTITLASGATIYSKHADVQDFSQQVEYNVICEDGSTVTYSFLAYVQDNSRTIGWVYINYDPKNGGSSFPSGMQSYNDQTMFYCTAEAKQGYKFVRWHVNSSPTNITSTIFWDYIPLDSYDKGYLTAEFEQLPPVYYTVYVNTANSSQGDVSVSPISGTKKLTAPNMLEHVGPGGFRVLTAPVHFIIAGMLKMLPLPIIA